MSRVKICGLRRIEDIEAVNHALPDYIGFVFATSKCRVDIETAAMLKEKLDSRINAVGVFVNDEVSIIYKIVRNGIIDLIQLHGDEDDMYIERLKKVRDCPVIKAVSIGYALPVLPKAADYLLFDTLSAQRGGAGKAFDWRILANYSETSYFLAGGISIENVTEALSRLLPFCVDVSSGVETEGIKDSEKINEFVQTVRRIK